jgi:hypothetical protein
MGERKLAKADNSIVLRPPGLEKRYGPPAHYNQRGNVVDVFKFAFETVVVGLLALPWLLILADLLFPGSLTNGHENGSALLASVPEIIRQPAASALLFAVVYVLGSAVSPLAKDALDDDDLAIFNRKLPTESRIRQTVYCDHSQWLPYAAKWLPAEGSYRDNLCSPDATDASTEVFRAQETAVLLEGAGESQRTRQLHEQIIVLQGAVFSALLCFLLCLFGWGATKWPKSIRAGIAPLLILAFAGFSLYHHIEHIVQCKKCFWFDDPPLMEFVLLLAGSAGIWTAFYVPKPRRFGTWALAALLLGLISYGGWWWTQITYYEHVIHSFAAPTASKR